jgi:hypothetical protein
MIVEQINNIPVANARSISMPENTMTTPVNHILPESLKNATSNKCIDCGNTMFGSECADCAKQTVL